jgi:hypothetical protein
MPHKLKQSAIICIFLLAISFRASAPCWQMIVIPDFFPAEPYKQLIYATAMVETGRDTLAYNPLEEAAGIFQIRPVRLVDYNKRTGNNYSRQDLFNYKISEEIFLYYASQIGPYNFEKIARSWNGSGQKTDYYWTRIKQYL